MSADCRLKNTHKQTMFKISKIVINFNILPINNRTTCLYTNFSNENFASYKMYPSSAENIE
jgi:hypothetical protein